MPVFHLSSVRHVLGRCIACLLLILLPLQGWSAPAAGGEELADQALSPLAWLAGRWVGTGPGGEVEEIWSPVAGGEMLGIFRSIEDGVPVFYEFRSVRVEAGRVVLRLKHFDPDFSGWEMRGDSVDFALETWGENGARFDGIQFLRRGDDGMLVQIWTEPGAPALTFEYRRAEF